MGSMIEDLPYWQVNVPEDQRTEECPDFLRGISEKDRNIISTPSHQYQPDTWPVVRKKVADNSLQLFQRAPYELRRYLDFVWGIKKDYGSVLNFILTQRLHWEYPIRPRGKPFECEDDIKIIWNDWPYGIDKRIVHLVVWTKFELEDDLATGDLTDAMRAATDAYVRQTFSGIPEDHVGRRGSFPLPRQYELLTDP